VVVPDKGLDKTLVFRFENGQLTPAAFPEALGREGSGPRHLVFHPSQLWAYIANELDSTVTACSFDAATGQLVPFQIVSGLDDSYIGNSRNSEIEVHPSGKTLYVSNRGEDTIGVFSIESETGRICLIQSMPCGGKTPRFFALMPEGRFMQVLNEDSDSIVTLSVDAQSGMLSETGQSQPCGSPVCMVFRP
jgi:6-phosphogluconolactonase (cycloisomerase 2 family)